MLINFNYRLMHALFHISTVIIPRDRYRPEGFSPRVDIGRGMITILKWKKACINLFITYFNIELKRTKLTSHSPNLWIWVIDIGWGMITVLIWKKSCIDLCIERLDIVFSDFCPDICPWDCGTSGVYVWEKLTLLLINMWLTNINKYPAYNRFWLDSCLEIQLIKIELSFTLWL
jgi:hypothetical protein